MVSFDGGGFCKQSRWRHSVTVPHTRWRICVTMVTLWQQQLGGYALLWNRYSNIQITSAFAVEDVYTELVTDVFYIFNSTVIDWTYYYFFLAFYPHILTIVLFLFLFSEVISGSLYTSINSWLVRILHTSYSFIATNIFTVFSQIPEACPLLFISVRTFKPDITTDVTIMSSLRGLEFRGVC